jgi:hypothetical protein
VVARCFEEDRVIVTENAIDFRKLLGREELHPGLIIIPAVNRARSIALLLQAIDYLMTLGTPDDVMINGILEIGVDGSFVLSPR